MALCLDKEGCCQKAAPHLSQTQGFAFPAASLALLDCLGANFRFRGVPVVVGGCVEAFAAWLVPAKGDVVSGGWEAGSLESYK